MSVKNSFGKILLAIFAVCWLAVPVFAQKRQIRVASAADLQTVMPQIVKAYETRSGTSVEVVYGSSGNFYAQIKTARRLMFFSRRTASIHASLKRQDLQSHNPPASMAWAGLCCGCPRTQAVIQRVKDGNVW